MKCKETIRAMNSMMLKRKRTNLILSLSVAMLIFIASSSTRRVEGFKATSSQPIHQNITREALSFLKNKAVLEDIVGKQQPLDERTQATPSWHFDAGYFRESIDRINGHYKSAVVAIGQGNYSSAAKYFGELLHPLQDFYAHTNWVELEAMKLVGGGLFDSGKSYWWRPERDWQVHPERFTMVVAQGEKGSMPSGWKASYLSGGRGATPKDRIMQIATSEYTYYGLVSGKLEAIPDECHDDVGWWHTDEGGKPNSGLNKDEPGRPFHDRARALAVLQTKHEWDRLVELVRKTYGQVKVDELFEKWGVEKTPLATTPPRPAAQNQFPDRYSPERVAEIPKTSAPSQEERSIIFKNEAGYSAKMTVVYFMTETIAGGAKVPMAKSLVTSAISVGVTRTLVVPRNTTKGMPISVVIEGIGTTKSKVFETTVPEAFNGKLCFKSWGTIFDAKGGSC